MADRTGALEYGPQAQRAAGVAGDARPPRPRNAPDTPRRTRTTRPPSAAAIDKPNPPTLIPIGAHPTAPVTLSRTAYAGARRAGLAVDLSRAPPPGLRVASAVARSSVAQEHTTRSAPVSPWGKPRAWGQDTPSPVRGRSALVAHSPAISVQMPASPSASQDSPTRAPRQAKTWAKPAARPARTLEQLYDGAHERFDAPLTVPVGLINQGNSCFASVVRLRAHTDPPNARVLPTAVQLPHGAALDAPAGPVQLYTPPRGHVRRALMQIPFLRRDPACGAHAVARDGRGPHFARLHLRCDAPAPAL